MVKRIALVKLLSQGLMIAIQLSDGQLSMVDVQIPEPQEGEALLRVLQVGICNTDIELARG
jgi:D-arabinose 1-dehydrogenase-like Zn-dependent alcohol dehydrogenase